MTQIATVASDSHAWLAARSEGIMPRGAVVVHAPSHVFQAPGGGENQLVQTALAVDSIGVPVRPFCPWRDQLAGARLLHVFGMSREGLELARVARAKGVPVVLSPICWYDPRALAALANGPIEAARALAGWAVRRALPRYPSWRRQLLATASAVLPNSYAESRQLVMLFGVDREAIHVVPNGVDPAFADASPAAFREWFGPEEFVLYVGRVEPRKNVRGLIEACSAIGRHVVVIGNPPPGHRDYLRDCRIVGGNRMTWMAALPHNAPMLASAYAAARVFALPSWFETPGLAALEAALVGQAVVITPYGCTREYFGDRALYARPDRPKELAHSLETAWRIGPDPALAEHVAANFLWSDVARQTVEVYDQVAG